jgi:peptide/nickel transport system ATP-binding protein
MLSDRIAVMSKGELVEVGMAGQIINDPQDPYTQRLIAAVPVPNPEEQAARREARDKILAEYLRKQAEEEAGSIDSSTGTTAIG